MAPNKYSHRIRAMEDEMDLGASIRRGRSPDLLCDGSAESTRFSWVDPI
nr:hypothetical protein [Herbiconiux ginsengi]